MGPSGPPGPAGSGQGISLTPDQFGTKHNNITFAGDGKNQAFIDANFPLTKSTYGCTTSDMIDWACWQEAVLTATNTNQPIEAYGKYYINRAINVPQINYNLTIKGNHCEINTTNTNTYSVFYRIPPADNSATLPNSPSVLGATNGGANIMVQARYQISGITIYGQGNTQKGFDFGPSYGAKYESCWGYDLGTFIHLKFALRTYVINCFATGCNIGFIADIGNWSGASNSNSQSNHTTFEACRTWSSPTATNAFKIVACSGVMISECIIEGKKVVNGIDFDGLNSTVVKDFTVRNTHFECEQGATNAFIKVRMREGNFILDGAFGQYPAILLDAGSTAGYLLAHIKNIPYWVGVSGKAMYNNTGTNYIFENNHGIFLQKSLISPLFNGNPVTECTGPGCGMDKFKWVGLPSF